MKTPLLAFVLLSSATFLNAAAFKQAEVTRVLNDVRVLSPETQSAPARIGDVIRGRTAVATGVQSRAELIFQDKTLTRLGANTLFRVDEGTRKMDLERGVLFLQVPKRMGGATVRTATVTAAVTGTTIMIEYQPNGAVKFIVLEGSLDLSLKDKPSTFTTLEAGDMIIMNANARSFPEPVKVDIKRLMTTSKLLDDTSFAPIGNTKEIAEALADQDKKITKGELLKTAFKLPARASLIHQNNEVRREIHRFQQPPVIEVKLPETVKVKEPPRRRPPPPPPPQRTDTTPNNRG